MAVKNISLTYDDYVRGIQTLTPEEQLDLIEVISVNLKTIMKKKQQNMELKKTAESKNVEESPEHDPVFRKLQPAIQAGLIIPHSKKLRKASMPTIKVTGKPLSQIIIEDRR